MYGGLGIGWANTTLAIVAVVMVPIPVVLMKLGPRLRSMGKFAAKPPVTTRDRPDFGAEMAQKDTFSVTVEAGAARGTV